MNNLWLIFGITLFCSVGLIIIGVILIIKKEKFYKLSIIIIIFLVSSAIICDWNYIKDLTYKETIEIKLIYNGYEDRYTSRYGVKQLYFNNNVESITLFAPTGKKYHLEMNIGKTYLIEYFKNSKVIKSYTLIE